MEKDEESAFWQSLTEDMRSSGYARMHRKVARVRRRDWVWTNVTIFVSSVVDLAHMFVRTRELRVFVTFFMILSSLMLYVALKQHQWETVAYTGILTWWLVFCSIMGPAPPRDIETEDGKTAPEAEEE